MSDAPTRRTAFPYACNLDFVQRGFGTLSCGVRHYCHDCDVQRRQHRILQEFAGYAPAWGPFVGSHVDVCSSCGVWSGPWVKESEVNAGL